MICIRKIGKKNPIRTCFNLNCDLLKIGSSFLNISSLDTFLKFFVSNIQLSFVALSLRFNATALSPVDCTCCFFFFFLIRSYNFFKNSPANLISKTKNCHRLTHRYFLFKKRLKKKILVILQPF